MRSDSSWQFHSDPHFHEWRAFKNKLCITENMLEIFFLGATDAYTEHWILLYSQPEWGFLMRASKINNPVMLGNHEKQKENEIRVKALKLVSIKHQCQSSWLVSPSSQWLTQTVLTKNQYGLESFMGQCLFGKFCHKPHISVSLPEIISWTKGWFA